MSTPEESGRCAASRFGLRPTRLAAQRMKEDLHHFLGHQLSIGAMLASSLALLRSSRGVEPQHDLTACQKELGSA